MTNNTITITMTAEQLQKINQLKATREGKTDQELVEQIFERGLYDLAYRSKRNKQQWVEFKAYKQAMKAGQ